MRFLMDRAERRIACFEMMDMRKVTLFRMLLQVLHDGVRDAEDMFLTCDVHELLRKFHEEFCSQAVDKHNERSGKIMFSREGS